MFGSIADPNTLSYKSRDYESFSARPIHGSAVEQRSAPRPRPQHWKKLKMALQEFHLQMGQEAQQVVEAVGQELPLQKSQTQ